ncbi:MAG TPA: class I SAM-dependent methyltransferase [Candidatus Acidoferrales bacterium]|nr:class I SAM-dependent methyltransferase [Candidatus Acidoferrales bacterium]
MTLLAIALLLLPAAASGQLGARSAKEWIERLDDPQRIAGLKIARVVAALKLKPGDVVADIGAGSGAFSLPFARAVAPGGKVYAVDIDQELLDHIAAKARREGVENIQTIRGESTDPRLPARDVDLAFFHDVLHHIEKRQPYLKTLAGYLKPGARVAVIEMNPHDPKSAHRRHGPEMLLEKKQVTKWLEEIGFHPVEEFDLYGEAKWFIVYSRRPQASDAR